MAIDFSTIKSLTVNGFTVADTIDLSATALPVPQDFVKVFGNAGEDTIYGPSAILVAPLTAGSNMTLNGGADDDIIVGGPNDEKIDGEGGYDRLWGNGGNDNFWGGDGFDSIWGGAGNDYISGGTGDDFLYGEAGEDEIDGEDGFDQIDGGDLRDIITGGVDDDVIDGSQGVDQIHGDGGDDTIYGGSGEDYLDGGADNDELYGNSDVDTLIGDQGNDWLFGGTGNDTFDGGIGQDNIISNEDPAAPDEPFIGDIKGTGGPGCDIEDGNVECKPKAVPDAKSGKKNVMLVEPAPGILANDDADGDCDGSCSVEITDIAITQAPSYGTLTLDVDPITGIETGGFTYTPASGFTGIVTFQYTITNEHGTSDPATVTLTIENTPPVAVADIVSRQFGGYLAGVAISAADVLQNDSDENGDTLTTSLVGNAVNGTVTRNSDGSFTFFPASLSTTSGSFDYQAFDGSAYSNTVTVTLTLSNPAPVAYNDSFSGIMGGSMLPSPISFSSVLANDTDVNDTNVHVGQYTQPSQGSVSMSTNGTFTYTPPFGYSGGTVTFTYLANDGLSSSNTATVTLTISQALWLSDAPVESPTSEPLTTTQAERMLIAAGQLWQRAGVDRRLIQEALRSATLVITDLPDAQLGASSGDTIYLDVNAAGYGWFVDHTPRSHREFTSDLDAQEGSAADGRVGRRWSGRPIDRRAARNGALARPGPR